jgi:hypothetical protein
MDSTSSGGAAARNSASVGVVAHPEAGTVLRINGGPTVCPDACDAKAVAITAAIASGRNRHELIKGKSLTVDHPEVLH